MTSAPGTSVHRERERARQLRFDKAWKRAVAAELAETDWLIPARVTARADSGNYCVITGAMFSGCGYCAHIIANRPAFEAISDTGERISYTSRTWYASELVDLTKQQQQRKLRELARFLLAGLREIVGDDLGNDNEGGRK